MRKKTPELIVRVKEMELRFDSVCRELSLLEAALGFYDEFSEDLDALKVYMESGQWKKDFEADEAGLIPADLKRGVLSEDGLYDVLDKVGRALSRAAAVFGR